MKTKSKIIVALLTLVLVMMMGYAIFSDTITINGTATAKGDFNYTVTVFKGAVSDINSSNMYSIYNFDGAGDTLYSKYTNASNDIDSSITYSDNLITYVANFKYPSQKQYFTAKITNTGSIPITIDLWYEMTSNSSSTGTYKMSDGNLVDITMIKEMVEGSTPNPYGFTTADYLQAKQLVIVGLDDVYAPKKVHDALVEDLNTNEQALPKLETGESFYIIFNNQWKSDDLNNKQIIGVDITSTNKITLPIKQYVAK